MSFIKKMVTKVLTVMRVVWHYGWSVVGNVLLKGIQDKMIIVGVTGTKGKSTVVNVLSFVLKKMEIKYASCSTLEASDNTGSKLNTQKMTMPGRWILPMYFKKAYLSGARVGIIEATSSGLSQFRGDAFNFDIVAITNLQKEHIEIHGGFDNYKKAKGRLFKLLTKHGNKFINNKKIDKVSIVNFDDDNSGYYLEFKADKKYVISLKENKNSTKVNILNLNLMRPDNLIIDATGIHFDLDDTHFDLGIYGTFNVYNILIALTILKALKLDMNHVSEVLREYKGPKGRMEFVKTASNTNVVVDYAHTPDSLKAVLTTLKEMGFKKIISVIGACGGTRDKWKRPEIGKVAGELSDYVIVTNEDPYDEDPHKIMNGVYMGIANKEQARIVPDRIEAIHKAIDMTNGIDDVVILTGKGSEKVIMVKGGVRGFTKQDYLGDYEVARQYLEKK
jgi:UDP-N-acetylmuramoyl-L-alanyl-D-glutamate--2,6-diaminopimelate ligase